MTDEIETRKPREQRRKLERSRARAKQAKPKGIRDDKPRRVRHCMSLMATGNWIPGVTTAKLASLWKISERAVEGDAAEASRRIREGVQLDDDLRASVVATMADIASAADSIARTAKRLRQPRTAVEALRTKLDAVRSMAGVAGVEKPKKLEVEGGGLGELIGLAFSTPRVAEGQ